MTTVATSRSFAAYVEAVHPQVPSALISTAGFAAMARVAELLPPKLGHNAFGFEVSLAGDSPSGDSRAADLLLAIDPTTRDLDETLTGIPTSLRREPAWAALGRLRRGISLPSPAGRLAGRLANLWIEFDVSGPAPLLPSVFFMPVAQLRPGRQDHARAYEITREALKLVAVQRPVALDSGALQRCFAALPPVASIFQVGVMNSRPNRLLRICAAVHNPRTILAFLEAIGYPADLAPVERHIRWLRRFTDRVRLNLDLDHGVRPKLGIECYVHGARSAGRWAELLDALARVGCADLAKARALLAFPGVDSGRDTQVAWPTGLSQAGDWLGAHALLERRRSLHHVKFVYEPEQPLVAKAYLAVDYHWRSPAEARRPA